MRTLLVSLLLLIGIVYTSAQVKTLTAATFDSVVNGDIPAFVEFYAPWCGHCKALAPEYEIVGEAFKQLQSSVIIAKVDCDAEKDLCSQHGISGYPTLKWFPKGDVDSPESYNGGRTADDIISFINGKAGTKARSKKAPSLVVELDESNFERIALDPTKHVFVEFFAPWCGHCKRLAPDWEKLAAAFEGEDDVVIAKFDADKHKQTPPKYGVTGFPTLIFFSKDNKEGEKYQEGRELETLVQYVNRQAGANRLVDGNLAEDAGILDSFKTLIESFIQDGADRDDILEKAKEEAAKLTGEENAKLTKVYLHFLKKYHAEGAGYIENEIARLERMLKDTSSITRKKIDEFTRRKNILKLFQK